MDVELDTESSKINQQVESVAECSTCSEKKISSPFIYALGSVQPKFSSLDLEREFAQVASLIDSQGLTDQQLFHKVISLPENRYIVRQICWIFSVSDFDTYVILPRDSVDFSCLVETVRADPIPGNMDVIVGVREVDIPDSFMCSELGLPFVTFDNLYSFDIQDLVDTVPKPKSITAKEFKPVARDLIMRIQQIADNTGATDEHRALNYLLVRYPAIYAITCESYGREDALSNVYTRKSRLSTNRDVIDVIFSFVNRRTDVTTKYFVRVDTTGRYPFIVSKMSPYYVYDTNP